MLADNRIINAKCLATYHYTLILGVLAVLTARDVHALVASVANLLQYVSIIHIFVSPKFKGRYS